MVDTAEKIRRTKSAIAGRTIYEKVLLRVAIIKLVKWPRLEKSWQDEADKAYEVLKQKGWE